MRMPPDFRVLVISLVEPIAHEQPICQRCHEPSGKHCQCHANPIHDAPLAFVSAALGAQSIIRSRIKTCDETFLRAGTSRSLAGSPRLFTLTKEGKPGELARIMGQRPLSQHMSTSACGA